MTPADPLQDPLGAVPGVGPARAAALASAGLHTVEDLLLRFPLRYEDRSQIAAIASLRPGTATIAGEIVSAEVRPTRRPRFTVFEVRVRDDSGEATAVWFNQRFLAQVFRPGQQAVLHGTVEWTSQGPQFQSPQYEFVDLEPDQTGRSLHSGRIVPVHERVGPLSPKLQRDLVARALARLPAHLPDPLPEEIRTARQLPGRRQALVETHFPPDGTSVEALNACRTPAQVRLILEEFLLFQLALAEQRAAVVAVTKPHRVAVDAEVRALARRVLPFRLTEGQKQALREIVDDLQRPVAMNRLLQGDVGAGKTMVALLAAVVAMASGLQVVLMAPTELLAEQHARTVAARLAGTPFRSVLLTGGPRSRARAETLAAIESGAAHLVVGTHAVLEDPALFHGLGLVIIDEQHRFGVGQRARLRTKGRHPDVLVMTATPIPRTLTLTAFGDLDVSVIRDLPPGRLPVKTTVRPESRRDEVYAFVREQVAAGRQVYVVLPLIEESDKVDARAAVEMAETLRTGALAGLRLAVLHGRLTSTDKQAAMQAFVSHAVDVLVTTTVIEVGVDVANASLMVVEHAERFGLAQLHQLRGRVGRGADQSYCVLLYERPLSDEAKARLEAMAETTDGFVIAERDLAIRGPGDMFGTRQAGLPTLRIGDLRRDQPLMAEAHALARDLVARLPADALPRRIARLAWAGRFNLAQVG
ncbi:MAG: ATP-dependent DNA helicase RecG [Acidobacteria bacterium]|nr:ATP-dependent DNA helicase RecG [Acidobacteriota bacterium]